MKKFILFIFLFLFTDVFSFASQVDTVTLELSGFDEIQVPKTNTNVYSAINQDGEFVSDEDYISNRYFKPEDDVTDNEKVKQFYRFVDRVIINNKFNEYTSRIAE